eukprot:TRINITY_DN5278_c1_g1_i1.p1 TRINITY_DN5278_c1_g1~~TRINITY_DN5278_c1_g1_i1.p1  ORF type:complete len:974 (+),score=424.07 TRINITY_DN5278_c1_g1_i1:1210-4131(+)
MGLKANLNAAARHLRQLVRLVEAAVPAWWVTSDPAAASTHGKAASSVPGRALQAATLLDALCSGLEASALVAPDANSAQQGTDKGCPSGRWRLHLLAVALQPYLCALSRWLVEGTLEDPLEETFLAAPARTAAAATAAAATAEMFQMEGGGVRLDAQAVPRIFAYSALRIALAGHDVALMRSIAAAAHQQQQQQQQQQPGGEAPAAAALAAAGVADAGKQLPDKFARAFVEGLCRLGAQHAAACGEEGSSEDRSAEHGLLSQHLHQSDVAADIEESEKQSLSPTVEVEVVPLAASAAATATGASEAAVPAATPEAAATAALTQPAATPQPPTEPVATPELPQMPSAAASPPPSTIHLAAAADSAPPPPSRSPAAVAAAAASDDDECDWLQDWDAVSSDSGFGSETSDDETDSEAGELSDAELVAPTSTAEPAQARGKQHAAVAPPATARGTGHDALAAAAAAAGAAISSSAHNTSGGFFSGTAQIALDPDAITRRQLHPLFNMGDPIIDSAAAALAAAAAGSQSAQQRRHAAAEALASACTAVEGAAVAMPPVVVLQRALHQPIAEHCSAVSGACVRLLLRELRLLDVAYCLRSLYVVGTGQLLDLYCDVLFSALWSLRSTSTSGSSSGGANGSSGSAGGSSSRDGHGSSSGGGGSTGFDRSSAPEQLLTSEFKLTGLLQASLSMSVAGAAGSSASELLSHTLLGTDAPLSSHVKVVIDGAASAGGDGARSLPTDFNLLRALKLHCALPAFYGCLLGPQTLDKYARAHALVMHVKYALHVVSGEHTAQQKALRRRGTPAPAQRRAHLLLYAVLQFVRALHEYTAMQTADVHWQALTAQAAEARSPRALAQVHDAHVRALLLRLFLQPSHAVVLGYLLGALEASVAYTRHCSQLFTNERSGDDNVRQQQDGTAMSMQQAADRFYMNVQFAMANLQQHKYAGGEENVEQLLLSLTFNAHYGTYRTCVAGTAGSAQ